MWLHADAACVTEKKNTVIPSSYDLASIASLAVRPGAVYSPSRDCRDEDSSFRVRCAVNLVEPCDLSARLKQFPCESFSAWMTSIVATPLRRIEKNALHHSKPRVTSGGLTKISSARHDKVGGQAS